MARWRKKVSTWHSRCKFSCVFTEDIQVYQTKIIFIISTQHCIYRWKSYILYNQRYHHCWFMRWLCIFVLSMYFMTGQTSSYIHILYLWNTWCVYIKFDIRLVFICLYTTTPIAYTPTALTLFSDIDSGIPCQRPSSADLTQNESHFRDEGRADGYIKGSYINYAIW